MVLRDDVRARVRSLVGGTPIAWGLAPVVLAGLVVMAGGAMSSGARAANDTAVIFGSDAGVVLTFVQPEKTERFEAVLDRFRATLAASEDPIRQQQSGAWRVFRSPDPGPNGSALYVSLMEPVLRGANYSIVDIASEELPEDEAQALLHELRDCLAQPQSTLSLETIVDMTQPLPDGSGDGTP